MNQCRFCEQYSLASKLSVRRGGSVSRVEGASCETMAAMDGESGMPDRMKTLQRRASLQSVCRKDPSR